MSLTESIVEDAALEWFWMLSYTVGLGPHLTPSEPAAERDGLSEVVLAGRLREAIRRLNPAISESRTLVTLVTLCDPAPAGLPKLLSRELSLAAANHYFT
jgi:type I restriction enzyme R subunit